MYQNEWGPLGLAVAAVFAILVLNGLARMIRGLARGGHIRGSRASQMDRISAAARRVLEEQQAGRARTPAARPKKTAGRMAVAPKIVPAMLTGSNRTPAVIRRGGLIAGREPVIQRRR